MKNKILIGAHVSVAGGAYKGIENAEKIGAEAIQIFGSSPRQYRVKEPDAENVALFKDARKKSSVSAVFLHAPYLINISSPDDGVYQKSFAALEGHLRVAEALEADGLIFHVGSGRGLLREIALQKAVNAMRTILERVKGKVPLVVENAAGGEHKIGARVEDIKMILKGVSSKRVKVCFDTAHAFEAGWLRYTKEDTKEFFDGWDKEIGREHIVAVHANDSKTAFGSHHDRHENIGKGHIGIEGFKNLAKEKRLSGLPWILEVPGFSDEGPDKENIDILRSIFK